VRNFVALCGFGVLVLIRSFDSVWNANFQSSDEPAQIFKSFPNLKEIRSGRSEPDAWTTSLRLCIQQDDIDILWKSVGESTKIFDMVQIATQTLLHLAVASNAFKIISFMCEKYVLHCSPLNSPNLSSLRGANVNNSIAPSHITPLQQAAAGPKPDTVKLLLSLGANINQQSTSGYTALHYAIEANSYEMVEELLKNGATDSSPVPALIIAVQTPSPVRLGMLNLLANKFPDSIGRTWVTTVQTKSGHTRIVTKSALSTAASSDFVEAVNVC